MLILWIHKCFIWISMTSKVIEGLKSSSNFSVNTTLPLLDRLLMLPPPNCWDLSLSISFSLPLSFSYSLSLYIALYFPLLPCKNWSKHSKMFFICISMILKVTWGHFYVARFFFLDLLIKLQPWLTFLWTTFVLVFSLFW